MVTIYFGAMRIATPKWSFILGAVSFVSLAIVMALLPSIKNFYGHRDGITIREDVSYRPDSANDKHRLDLYLPTHTREPFPLLVFVHGGIWKPQGRRYLQPATGLYGTVGVNLAHKGVGVAVLGYRQYPEAGFAEGLADLATAVAFVQKNAAQWGADPSAVVVAGHSNGGMLVSLLALDPKYLRSAGADAERLRGFVSIAAAYDAERTLPSLKAEEAAILTRCAGGKEGLATFSPIRFVRPDAPPMLLMTARGDFPFLTAQYHEMVQALAPAGDKITAVELLGDDHMSMILNLGTPKDSLSKPLVEFIRRVTQHP